MSTFRGVVRTCLLVMMLMGLVLAAPGQNSGGSADDLEKGFQQPPDSAKPRIWWHWMNGNVTKEGITADLEWMHRVGIAGMQMFDGNLATPQFVDKRLVWMTPDWKDAFHHAGAEADRLNLEMSMAASGGWSETAGPWVKPNEAMKKVVWSETVVQGPRKFAAVLTHPPTVNGRFQDITVPADLQFPEPTDLPGAKPQPKTPPPPPDPTFYGDIKVIAFRLPEGEVRMADMHPKVTSSAPSLDAAALMDGDVARNVAVPYPEGGKPAWIEFEFAKPYRSESFTIAAGTPSTFGGTSIPDGEVDISQDGAKWETLVTLPGAGHAFSGFPVRTYSYPETTAKYYRIVMKPGPPSQFAALFGLPQEHDFHIAELDFTSMPRVNHWQEKAGFANMLEYASVPTPSVPPSQAISLHNVVDLTSKMRPDGTLNWDVPAGKWAILRMGYSLTGEKNHPASPEATGYEVDKLSAKHVNDYAKEYVDMISGALGPYFGKSFRYFLMDSWEANDQNWTEELISDFQRLRGYDPTPYLPVLTGRVVESADASDRFLWDFRRTIADLLAENHYGVATKYFHKYGVGLYAEAMGAGMPTIGDGLQDKGEVDIPMGEFWTPLPGQTDSPEHPADLREAASAAHIYGKGLAGAESFTTMPTLPMWGQSPFYLKPLGDNAFALGINRIIFHEGAEQPFVDDQHKPGMTLGFFGQNYTRNITWAEQARAWNSYLARCSYLLQQGSFVGDIAYFYGEGAPVTVPFWKQLVPAPPEGYAYDDVNRDVLLTMTVKDGRIVLPSGMSYRILVVPDDKDRMTLPIARKIRDLVADGGIVVSPPPGKSPSLSGYPSADEEIRFIGNEVWGPIDGKSVTGHEYGKGKIYWGKPLDQVLAAEKTPPDLEHNRPSIDTDLVWIHRHTAGAEIYFVANQRDHNEEVETSYRIEGKAPELWHPDSGMIEPAAYRIENGRTIVPLHFDPDGSVFVVFREAATAPSRTEPRPESADLLTVQGSWDVTFPPNWGAPPQIKLDSLTPWNTSSDTGVKYFSGTATYSKDIDVSQDWFRPGAKLVLDLGMVREIAEVSVNGKPLDEVLWKPPFRVDVTSALKAGTNHLEIKVTNLWPNRFIGDQQPGVTKRYTFTDFKPFNLTKDSPLMDSGLLGPVKLVSVTMH